MIGLWQKKSLLDISLKETFPDKRSWFRLIDHHGQRMSIHSPNSLDIYQSCITGDNYKTLFSRQDRTIPSHDHSI